MRVPIVVLCPVFGLALVLVSCTRPDVQVSPSPHSSTPPTTSRTVQPLRQPHRGAIAGPMEPDLRVGPIFLDGAAEHVCTGSVVHSAAGNLVITAAHCLGGATKFTFVPGFAGDARPTDVWTADAVYLDPRWVSVKDPHADYAIARVSNPTGASVESRTGLALTLGDAPAPGSRVTVMGYPSGEGGSPIGCQASTSLTDSGYPALVCEGLVGGTSGAPWVSGTTVTGLIGGLQGGGCAENISFSSPFDQRVGDLLARAVAGGPGDALPKDAPDVC
jgi:hypothetical protein